MSAELAWTTLAAAVMVIGLCGVVIPLLPGLALIWATALVYGLVVGFGAVGVAVMLVLSGLVALSVVKSVVVPRRAAASSGASGWSQLGGVAGAVIGFFVIPVIGLVIGALVGLLVAEAINKGNWSDAWTATKATARGFGLSVAIDLTLGLAMIVVWTIWAATVVL